MIIDTAVADYAKGLLRVPSEIITVSQETIDREAAELNEFLSSSYCPLIFHGLYARRFPGDTQQVAPCCLAKPSQRFSGHDDLMSNRHLENIRNDVRNNQKPEACEHCWENESYGGYSPRAIAIDKYKAKNLPVTLQQSELNKDKCYSIDYNTLPICNAKCVICSSKYSSLWAADEGIKIIAGDELKYDHLLGTDLDDVKSIYFNGGEPLLTGEHLTLLKKIKDLSNVDISYNTNGSCYPSAETLALWDQATSVQIFFSIDGIGKRFEETRTPLKWAKVSGVIKKVNLLDGIPISCAYTIGTHNVFDLEDTINWFASLPNFDVTSNFYVHTVYGALSLQQTTPQEKESFKSELLKFKDFDWYNEIVNSF